MTDIERWGDSQQYRAEPHANYEGDDKGVMPKVTLLWMTPDPLGAVGAMAAMYEGRVVRDLSDLTDEDRLRYWNDVRKTHLDTPLEAVQFHFMLEGVDRSFTHQLVRKRQAAYAQESLRFAVPGALNKATSLPPSLQGTTEVVDSDAPVSREQGWRMVWDNALGVVDRAYHQLVASGMPAEEARGLLPHCTATRANYLVNLRSLKQEAGNRLCTQAQFHWRIVMSQIVQAIRNYGYETSQPDMEWQCEAIADTFRPVCYELGHCPFKASFDRACSIRERVDYFAKRGVPSQDWDKDYQEKPNLNDPLPWSDTPDPDGSPVDVIPRIKPEEWLMNPGAARRTS